MRTIVSDHRTPDHPVDPIFVHRYSPRAMSGEPITDAQIMCLLEAARWAPSSYNEQPWRFIFAKRGTAHFDPFMHFLLPANQAWANTAAALFIVASKKTFTKTGSPNGVHQFDAGAAWQNFALQGAQMGLVVHAMAGFDKEKARAGAKIPDDFEPYAMIAVGRPGRVEDLPADYRAGETPSPRKPIREWAFEGTFKG